MKKKVYEITFAKGGKVQWILAVSKKAVKDFFGSNPPQSIIERKDVQAEEFMFSL